MQPRVDLPRFPDEYGSPPTRLTWAEVEQRLAAADVYWFASTRPDGRPHVVPRDGVWFGGGLFYGGSPETVHSRNVQSNPNVVAHVGDGHEAVIVEGSVSVQVCDLEAAEEIVAITFDKYPQYGRPDVQTYLRGVPFLRPAKVLAWTDFTKDATRFRF